MPYPEGCRFPPMLGRDLNESDWRSIRLCEQAIAAAEAHLALIRTLPEIDAPIRTCITPDDLIPELEQHIGGLRATIAAIHKAADEWDPEEARLDAIHAAQDAARKEAA